MKIIYYLTEKGRRNTVKGHIFCYIHSVCSIKNPLNKETPKKDNPVLNQLEIIVNAKRLEVMLPDNADAIKSSTKAGHCPKYRTKEIV